MNVPDNERQLIESRLRQHVDKLAGLIGPRHLGQPKTIEATTGLITSCWVEQGYDVREEHFEAIDQPAKNLIVETQGTTRSQQIVVLGAHYDTVACTPGADDNASAVAVMLEVSRLLAGYQGRRTLRCVAFACEEPPYFNCDSMGSQHNARIPRTAGENIVGMLCLEMVGYYKDEPGSQSLPPGIPKWCSPLFPKCANFLAAVGNLKSKNLCWQFRRGFLRGSRRLKLFSICLPEMVQAIRLSDNSSYWDQGYPALMLTDTSFLRNPHYHQATDTPDTLDYGRMTEVTLGVASAVKRLLK